MLNWMMGFIDTARHAPRPLVTFDEVGVRRCVPRGEDEYVRWDDLQAVTIVTTDEGPWVEDVYWLLAGAGGRGCAIANGAMPPDLLARLQELEGFDHRAVIDAMGSCDDASFSCWRRGGGDVAPEGR